MCIKIAMTNSNKQSGLIFPYKKDVMKESLKRVTGEIFMYRTPDKRVTLLAQYLNETNIFVKIYGQFRVTWNVEKIETVAKILDTYDFKFIRTFDKLAKVKNEYSQSILEALK